MKKFNLMFVTLSLIVTSSAFAAKGGYNMKDPNLSYKPKTQCAQRAAAERAASKPNTKSVASKGKSIRGNSVK